MYYMYKLYMRVEVMYFCQDLEEVLTRKVAMFWAVHPHPCVARQIFVAHAIFTSFLDVGIK